MAEIDQAEHEARPLASTGRKIELAVVLLLLCAGAVWLLANGCKDPTTEELLAWEIDKGLQGRPTVILDLDANLRHSGTGGGLMGMVAGPRASPVLAGAGEVIPGLREKLNVVMLTARPVQYGNATNMWLEANGVSLVPVLCAERPLSSLEAQAEYKRERLAELRGLGFNLHASVADRPMEAVVYAQEGLVSCFIIAGAHDPGLKRLRRRLEDAEAKGQEEAVLYVFDATSEEPLWDRLAEALDKGFEGLKPYPLVN